MNEKDKETAFDIANWAVHPSQREALAGQIEAALTTVRKEARAAAFRECIALAESASQIRAKSPYAQTLELLRTAAQFEDAAPADNDAEYGPSLVAFNLKTGVAYCPYCKTEFERQSDGKYLTFHDCKKDR